MKLTNFEFEGNLQGVSEGQLEFIGNVLKERGYKSGKVLFEPVGKANDNTGGNIKRIVVEKDGSTFKMIAKIAPIIENIREMHEIASKFRNEHYMYTEVLPKFSKIMKAAKVPESERLRYPTCYGSNIEAPNEIILFEDLLLSDYVVLDKFKSFTDETVMLVLKNVAILHSLSYALKHHEPETYEEYQSKIVNIWDLFHSSEGMRLVYEKTEDEIQSIIDNDKYKRRIKGHVSKLTNISSKDIKIDDASKYYIIGHGDLWSNNTMFRIKNGKTVDCCIIDYQMSRHGCPFSDIHYMIFNCTDYKTRSKHYHDWIDYYHSELGRNLANFGLQVKNIYPRKNFDADLKISAKKSFGCFLFLATLRIGIEEAEIVKDAMAKAVSIEDYVRSIKHMSLSEETTLIIKNHIEGLVDSFVELGYIL